MKSSEKKIDVGALALQYERKILVHEVTPELAIQEVEKILTVKEMLIFIKVLSTKIVLSHNITCKYGKK